MGSRGQAVVATAIKSLRQQLGTGLGGLRQLHSSEALYKAPPGRNTRQQPAPARKDTSPGTALQKVADEEWTPVLHKETGDTYWWNEHTGQTTALGDPKPGTQMPAPVGPRTGSTVQQLGGLVAAGAGVGLVFSLFGRMF